MELQDYRKSIQKKINEKMQTKSYFHFKIEATLLMKKKNELGRILTILGIKFKPRQIPLCSWKIVTQLK